MSLTGGLQSSDKVAPPKRLPYPPPAAPSAPSRGGRRGVPRREGDGLTAGRHGVTCQPLRLIIIDSPIETSYELLVGHGPIPDPADHREDDMATHDWNDPRLLDKVRIVRALRRRLRTRDTAGNEWYLSRLEAKRDVLHVMIGGAPPWNALDAPGLKDFPGLVHNEVQHLVGLGYLEPVDPENHTMQAVGPGDDRLRLTASGRDYLNETEEADEAAGVVLDEVGTQ